MKLARHLAALVFIAATASFAAGSWSGYMVDSKCYESLHRNTASTSTVDRDMTWIIRRCPPNVKTKSFGVVLKNWQIFTFDPIGNTKAAEILHSNAKQSVYQIKVAGDMDKTILRVDSISMTGPTVASKLK
jgi:hypothetical protein